MQLTEIKEKVSLHRKVLKLMGNRFELSIVSDNAEWAHACIDAAIAEIRRIEELLTTFKETSQTHLINQNAGIRPVKVDKEVFDLIQRSLKISALTQGAFDISYGSIDKRFWNFDTRTALFQNGRPNAKGSYRTRHGAIRVRKGPAYHDDQLF